MPDTVYSATEAETVLLPALRELRLGKEARETVLLLLLMVFKALVVWSALTHREVRAIRMEKMMPVLQMRR